LVQTKEEIKAKAREYSQRPEVKAKRKEYSQRYEVKAKREVQRQDPETKAKKKSYDITYKKTPKAKAYEKSRLLDPKRRAYQKELHSRPEVRTKIKEYKDNIRIQVLQTYSKRLSDSDIPCCICCGKNSHHDFLAIDHIAGRKQMDFMPELVKIRYSSKLLNHTLFSWIIENDFPNGFQILCANCNFAKGIKNNNNQCPMKNKPH
jgi:hypothetical protein